MAVSGRTSSDVRSAHNCDPCFTIGHHLEAYGFCVNCQEYLCKTCYECHLRTKASRNHQLNEANIIGKQILATKDTTECTEECTEKCTVHRKESIKFFCNNHEALGCNDCMTLHHRICALDYIPDKCRNIGESEDYREIVRKLDQNLTDVKQLAVDAEERKKAIEVYYADITKMISEFRKEINERLDQLQNKLLKEAKDMMTENKQKAQRVLDSCTNIIYDIKKFQSSLHDLKIAEQNEQLFITMKRAQTNLKTDAIMNNETALDETDVHYEFKRSKDIEIILERDILGKINRHSSIRKRCNQKARLCTLRKLPNLRSDFGFNLQADRGRTSHYIGKVDEFSPAQAAGLKEGDRIVEVDGANTDRETHCQVVGRIKAAGNSLTLLVVDDETDKYYKEKKMVISSKTHGLIRLGNPIYRNAENKY